MARARPVPSANASGTMSDPAGVRVELVCSTTTDTVCVLVHLPDLSEKPERNTNEAPDALDVQVPVEAQVPVHEVADTTAAAPDPTPSTAPTPLPKPSTELYQGTATSEPWKRPPLQTCSPEDFMLDFLRHAEQRGSDWEAVWDALDNGLRRTGKPSDVLGFYREICIRGGYLFRQSCKHRIKMPFVFMQTHNYYENHTYTDIGNKLLDLYERFLLPYENDRPADIVWVGCAVCGDRETGTKLACDGCGQWYHRKCVAQGLVRKSRIERFTAFLCVNCVQVPGGVPFRGVKRTLDEIDVLKCGTVDDNFQRHVAMRKRRGRPYDENYVSPIRNPDTGNILGKPSAYASFQTFQTELVGALNAGSTVSAIGQQIAHTYQSTKGQPPSFRVGPLL